MGQPAGPKLIPATSKVEHRPEVQRLITTLGLKANSHVCGEVTGRVAGDSGESEGVEGVRGGLV